MRQITNVEGIGNLLSLTQNQIYKLVRRREDPLPHRKIGKCLRFDLEAVFRWFDRQPGSGGTDIKI